MQQENFYERKEREAADKLQSIMARPMPKDLYDCMSIDMFNPWEMFPFVYGHYSGDFDRCAIEVLEELACGRNMRSDLGAEMFREMLCTSGLCSYGTSPRACFPNQRFRGMLPEFIAKWREHSLLLWGEDVTRD